MLRISVWRLESPAMAAPLRYARGHNDAVMVRLIGAAVNEGDQPQGK
jgi:hypothetical protein